MRTDDEILAAMDDQARLRYVLHNVTQNQETKGVARAIAELMLFGGFDLYEGSAGEGDDKATMARNVRKHWPKATEAELYEALRVVKKVFGIYRLRLDNPKYLGWD